MTPPKEDEQAERIQEALREVWAWYHSGAAATKPAPFDVALAVGVLSGAAHAWRMHLIGLSGETAPGGGA